MPVQRLPRNDSRHVRMRAVYQGGITVGDYLNLNKGELNVSNYIFCNKAICPDTACSRHPSKIPSSIQVEVAPLNAYGFCTRTFYTEKEIRI